MILPEHFEEAVLEAERALFEQALDLVVVGASRRGDDFEQPRQLAGEVRVGAQHDGRLITRRGLAFMVMSSEGDGGRAQ